MSEAVAIPPEASLVLPVLHRCLGDSLVAVYLHGSAVSGGLRPRSDLDVMAVIDRPTTLDTRRRLMGELLQISGRYPPEAGDPHPLELIVFRRADLTPPAYPARSEFVYGEWLRDECEAGVVPAPGSDPDLTLVLAQARQTARTLIGPNPAEVLPCIAEADIRRAIRDALPGLLGHLAGDERNVLLTLGRMWRTAATGEFVPKDVAAEWAMARLPEAGHLLGLARDGYLGRTNDDWHALGPETRRLAGELSRRIAAAL